MVSVIVPTYNYSRYIGRTLSSVLAQTYKDFEVIIVDDGSTDKTKEVVETFQDARIRYFFQKNQGACVARNRGVREAKGEYFLFEDADDMLEFGPFRKLGRHSLRSTATPEQGRLRA